MISSFSTYFLRVFAAILIFPFGWSLLVTAIILVNAPFRYMNSGCSGLSDCFGEKLLSVIQGENFLIEIGIASIIGAITVLGRLFELWLKDK
jgi:hypothetical protein